MHTIQLQYIATTTSSATSHYDIIIFSDLNIPLLLMFDKNIPLVYDITNIIKIFLSNSKLFWSFTIQDKIRQTQTRSIQIFEKCLSNINNTQVMFNNVTIQQNIFVKHY